MNEKLNFPKGINKQITELNKLPLGTYKISLSTPEPGKDWIWSNKKQGYLFTAHLPVKEDGTCEAGIFAGSDVVVDGKIDSEFTVTRTKNNCKFSKL